MIAMSNECCVQKAHGFWEARVNIRIWDEQLIGQDINVFLSCMRDDQSITLGLGELVPIMLFMYDTSHT